MAWSWHPKSIKILARLKKKAAIRHCRTWVLSSKLIAAGMRAEYRPKCVNVWSKNRNVKSLSVLLRPIATAIDQPIEEIKAVAFTAMRMMTGRALSIVGHWMNRPIERQTMNTWQVKARKEIDWITKLWYINHVVLEYFFFDHRGHWDHER